LDGIVSSIGLRVWGADFAQLEPSSRREQVHRLLREKRLLLVWDNFETVRSMPDFAGATPPLSESERHELRSFLRRVARAGRSAVIVTSRTDEKWLGDLRRIELGGLAPDEAIEYANTILDSVPAATTRRAKRSFADLLEWLGGHPLSMRVVLPHLATTEPDALLADLRGDGGQPPSLSEHREGAILDASVTYSFEHLGSKTQRLLVAVSLFDGVANTDLLGTLSFLLRRTSDAREADYFAEAEMDDWCDALDEAAEVGLLTRLGGAMYRVHPALPRYLTARWRSEAASAYERERAVVERALLGAHAVLGEWLTGKIDSGNTAFAFAIISRQRSSLARFLSIALASELWREAYAIASPLNEFFKARGLDEEAQAWADRARIALEQPTGVPPSLDSHAGELWLQETLRATVTAPPQDGGSP
jgi:hypothetical protein